MDATTSPKPFETIALEFVPPTVEGGAHKAAEEAALVLERARKAGIGGRIRHLMIPGMIDEDDDRPVPLKPRLDPLDFLEEFARQTPHRPEVLLSFGFVPGVESRVDLIRWLIQDRGNPRVAEEQAFVARLAELTLREKQRALFDLYKRCIDGVAGLGFPVSVHLEAPYGFSRPAFETFAQWLDYYPARRSLAGRSFAC